jgi:hypothetical protein
MFLTRVGFGAWAVGGGGWAYAWGDQDDAESIAWTLSFPGVTAAIAGARRPGQVDGWLPAATLELKEDDLAEVAAAVRATGAGTGPASPLLEAAPGR